MRDSGYALVTVYGAIEPNVSPASYAGVAYLADKGETFVTVLLPCGVKRFSRVPCMIKVPSEQTFVEFPRKEIHGLEIHGLPELTVNTWESFYERG